MALIDITFDAWVLETLKKLQALDPLAHIAGGYLRDLDNGRAVKDLDIYLHSGLYDDITDIVSATHPIAGGSVGEQYAISDANVGSAINFISEAGLPDLNVIMLTKPLTMQENIARFDFGICRIAFDGKSFVIHWSYDFDRMQEHFTLHRCVSPQTMLLSLARYKRLEQKYVGWDLVIPSKFSQLLPAISVSQGGSVSTLDEFEDVFA